jgi:lysophospholipase L1-like esterase/pimeloyl-ACP methyl ester carboxylesterase
VIAFGLLLATLFAALACPRGEPVRVACLGDSITFGALLEDRPHHAWPAQLAGRLGQGWEVRNYGVGGATLLRAADRPYLETEEFRAALEWEPDIAVVVLGTNDTCMTAQRPNWAHAPLLVEDARELVRRLRAAGGGERVLLCTPPQIFPATPGLSAERMSDLRERRARLPALRAALAEAAAGLDGVELVDLSRALTGSLVVDGVHPTPFGAEALAERLREAIQAPRAPPLDVAGELTRAGIRAERGDFHGLRALGFRMPDDGSPCVLVEPDVAAAGYPWIWRARFFGHEPDLDLELVDRGFHLAYVDVVDLYGAPAAIERMKRFHDLLAGLGLSQRAVLEGMSRGGLAILEYALAHPDDVAALYGDNPVCDFRSWPGGRNGQRSDEDWEKLKLAWGLSEEQAWAHDRGPLTRVEELVAARLPVFLVLGTADPAVPPPENGERLAARLAALDGEVHVWRKPGLGHHPHGLSPPAPLRRSLQRACGFEALPSVRAVPSAEHRGAAAGWGGGSWWDQLERLRTLAAEHPDLELVFLGDSITQGLTGAEDRLAHAGGQRPFDRHLGRWRAASLGLSGDRTEHLLYRLEHGALPRLRPRVIVLQVGVNNVNAAGHTGEETAAGIVAVVARLRATQPQARIVLCGPFPCGASPDDPRRLELDRVHELVAGLGDEERVLYRDLRPLFLEPDGSLAEGMAEDGVHVTAAGQDLWLAALDSLLAELLAP